MMFMCLFAPPGGGGKKLVGTSFLVSRFDEVYRIGKCRKRYCIMEERNGSTHKGKAAVGAKVDFGFVDVYVYSWMA